MEVVGILVDLPDELRTENHVGFNVKDRGLFNGK